MDLVFYDLFVIFLGLECVILVFCGLFSDFLIWYFVFCIKFKFLNFKGCKSVGDGSMKVIGFLLKLVVLVLNGCDVSDFGLLMFGIGVVFFLLVFF